jgi:hypothetical protein
MNYINNYTLNLTGTNFGRLDSYPKIDYYNSFLFTDLSNNTNISYPATAFGGSFFSAYASSSIKNIPNVSLWLDSNDTSYLKLSSNGKSTVVLSLCDKINNIEFNRVTANNLITTAYWPYLLDYSERDQLDFNTYYSILSNTPKVLNLLNSNFLETSSYEIAKNDQIDMFFVWRDNNYGENYYSPDRTIPFSFIVSDVAGVSSELIAYASADTDPRFIIGTRDGQFGSAINSITGLPFNFSSPHVLEFRHDGTYSQDFSSHNIHQNNIGAIQNSTYYLPDLISKKRYTTSVGYSGDNNTNNFYFCELILFKRIVSDTERSYLLNYLYNKWRLDYFLDLPYNTTIYEEITGGPFSNISYEDYSVLTSTYDLPVQSCVTQLIVSLSSFDESVSDIKRVLYSYNNIYGELNTSVKMESTSKGISAHTYFGDRYISILLKPDNYKFFSNFTVKLSVVRFDDTINKIDLNGSITQCGIRDLHNDNYLIDSQLLDDIDRAMLVFENKDLNQIYLTNTDISTREVHLTGGDFVELVNEETIDVQESIITLAEILDLEVTTKPVYKVPVIQPPVTVNINPVTPT